MASSLGIALVIMMMGTANHFFFFVSPTAKALSKQRPLIHKIEKQNPALSIYF